MSIVFLPYHQDTRLADGLVEVPGAPTTVEPDLPDAERWTRLRVLYDALADALAAADGPGRRAVVTGDCLAAVGTVTGLQRAGHDPGIVWFDAHGDVHTLASSTSGYLGGMPLRMLVGGDPDRLTGPLGTLTLPEHRAVLVDARDLDAAEADFLDGSAVVRRQVGEVAPEDLPAGEYVVHVDLDVTDPAALPGMLFPAPGGPGLDEVVAAVARMMASPRAIALEVACPWHPSDDDAVRAGRAEAVRRLVALV